ncbi:MAG: hypothetical protein HY720_03485, partial [Planctomycetes bacterium]|nr:hypothetical protein [Planctomycetota bacterium]
MDTLRARCAVVAPAFLAVLATGALAGTNPGPDECWAEMVRLSKVHGVPAPLIAAVAHAESSWQQFARATGNYAGRYYNEGDLVESFDGGIGMMQITGDPISGIDHDRIRTDWKYNLEIGVRTLRFKYDYSWYVVSVINPRHGLPAVPNWFPRGDPEILENWWYGLICYNGYSPASTVAEVYLARAENPGAYRLHASDVTLG